MSEISQLIVAFRNALKAADGYGDVDYAEKHLDEVLTAYIQKRVPDAPLGDTPLGKMSIADLAKAALAHGASFR